MKSDRSITIRQARVWDGNEVGFSLRDLHIVDGIVADAPDPGAESFDGRGLWVLPGLIDNHFHAYATSMDGFENERGPLSFAAVNGAARLGKALRRGFTTVRDVAGGDIGLLRARDTGVITAPRYFFTGPALSQTGGHGDPRSEHVDVCFSHGHMCEIVDGVDALRVAVRERLRTGAHAIKVMTSGGVFSLTDPLSVPQYAPEELQTVTAEAARRKSYVAAHAYSPEAIMHAIENGVRTIEHGNLLDRKTAREMARRSAYLVPTLAAYDAMSRRGAGLGLNEVSLAKNEEVLTRGQEAIRIALDAGVQVGFGSDLMGDLEDDQLRGVQLQVEASGAEATLHAMTVVNAEILGDRALGHLRPGAYGDAVVLSQDPMSTPSALWSPEAREAVLLAGRRVE